MSPAISRAGSKYTGWVSGSVGSRIFARAALFLECQLGAAERLVFEDQVKPGSPVEVVIDPEPGRPPLSVGGDVAHVGEFSVGIKFPVAKLGLVQQLRSLARAEKGEKAPAHVAGSVDGNSLFAQLRHHSSEFLRQRGRDYLVTVNDSLVRAASTAPSTTEQNLYFEAMDAIRAKGEAIRNAITETPVELLSPDAPAPEPLAETGAEKLHELALVDEREFEHWLAVSELISTGEARFGQVLGLLEQRLSHAAGRSMRGTANPISPRGIAESFARVVRVSEMRGDALRRCYQALGDAVILELGELYSTCNDTLIEAGVLPKIKPQYKRQGGAVGGGEGPAANLPEAAVPGDVGSDELPVEVGQGSPGPAFRGAPGGVANTSLGDVMQLLALRNRFANQRTGLPEVPEGGNQLAVGDVVNALKDLQTSTTSAPAGGAGFREQLAAALQRRFGPEGRRSLHPVTSSAVDLTSELVDQLAADPVLDDKIKDLIRKLEARIARQIIEDPDFMQQREHPLRRLIDLLGKWRIDLRSRGRDQHRGQEAIVQMVSEAALSDPNRTQELDEAANSLEKLLDRQNQALNRRIERAIDTASGRQQLTQARSRASESINETLAGSKIPQTGLDLVRGRWANLLVLAQLRGDPEGKLVRQLEAALSELTAYLQSQDGTVPDEAEVSSKIDALIDNVSDGADAGIRTQLADGMRQHLVAERNPKRWQPQAIPEEGLQLFPDLHPGEAATGSDPTVTPLQMSYWTGRVDLLDKGSWAMLVDEHGDSQPMQLAWRSDDATQLLFVNRTGRKLLELSSAELATRLANGESRLLNGVDLPLWDRSLQSLLQKMHGDLSHRATHDPLTGALTRKEFERLLAATLVDPDSGRQPHALCCVSLDNFKLINASLGHEAGDALLREIGEVMVHKLSDSSVLARIGGDEFAVLFRNCEVEAGRRRAEALRDLIAGHSLRWGNKEYSVTASIGLATINENTDSAITALRWADQASLSAKGAGGNRVTLFEQGGEHSIDQEQELQWVAQLDKIIADGRLELLAQVIMPTHSQARPMAEIVVRVRSDEGELVSPEKFIPAAERFGRVTALDQWILSTVLSTMADDERFGECFDALCVNLSGHSLSDEDFTATALQMIRDSGVTPSNLCFEVTETAAIANLATTVKFINEVRELGCRFSLDDFGSGQASYGYLKNLPIQFVKIDGSFVKDMDSDITDFAMVKSINELSHFLGKATIAEYVENDAILEKAREIGVDYVQGFGIAMPRPLTDVIESAKRPVLAAS